MTTAQQIEFLKELNERKVRVDGQDEFTMLVFLTANVFEPDVFALTVEEIGIVLEMQINHVEYLGQGVSVKRIA